MYRRILPVLAAAVLPTVFLVTVGSGAAEAVTNPVTLLGTVTCSTAGGVWNGMVTFSPPLKNGGTANNEEMIVKATLGNTGSSCVTSGGFFAIGVIGGQLRFHIPGTANNCATIFSGSALPTPTNTTAAPPRFKIKWTVPSGSAPTKWKQPANFVVTGAAAMTSITINGGTASGSFTPYVGPTATLSDSTWAAAAAAGCSSAGGLANLTLSTSTGSW
jgi:hypothetical protein